MVDALGFDEAVQAIVDLSRGPGGLVFTPNVDHVVRVEDEEDFRRAYECTAISLADGMPVVWASHLFGEPLPAKISGADIFPPLMKAFAAADLSVYLLGGRVGAGEEARRRLLADFPTLRIVGVGPPTREVRENPERLDDVERAIASGKPNLVVAALGSPLQELWSAKVAPRHPGTTFIGLGSVLDLVTGMVTRAPPILHKNGLEWAYRLATEPQRLWRRYLLRDPRFAAILARDLMKRRRKLRPPPPT